MSHQAGPALLRLNENTLQIPQKSVGLEINLDTDEGWPTPHPLAVKRVDIEVTFGGKTVGMSWEKFLTKMGFRQ